MLQKMLFCKPLPGMREEELLFLFTDPCLNGKIAFRSLQLTKDMQTIHDWANQPYSLRYWQMNVDLGSLTRTYTEVLNNPLAHSFIGLFNNRMVCQVDLYHVSADELKEHVHVAEGNCNLHILMLPPRQSFKGLTEAMLKAFIRFYFSFSAANCLYAEPDSKNSNANIAADRTGFKFLRTISMSYKTANLYSITRSQFFSMHHRPPS